MPKCRGCIRNCLPELQKLYRTLRDSYEQKAKMISDQNIHDLLASYGPPPPRGLEFKLTDQQRLDNVIRRYQNGDHTEADEKYYQDQGLDKEIRDAMRFSKENGPYFPVYRSGNWAVTGRYKVAAGGFDKGINGDELPDNVREFANREQSQKYMTTQNEGLHAQMYQQTFIRTNAKSPWREVTADEATSFPNARERYKIPSGSAEQATGVKGELWRCQTYA